MAICCNDGAIGGDGDGDGASNDDGSGGAPDVDCLRFRGELVDLGSPDDDDADDDAAADAGEALSLVVDFDPTVTGRACVVDGVNLPD